MDWGKCVAGAGGRFQILLVAQFRELDGWRRSIKGVDQVDAENGWNLPHKLSLTTQLWVELHSWCHFEGVHKVVLHRGHQNWGRGHKNGQLGALACLARCAWVHQPSVPNVQMRDNSQVPGDRRWLPPLPSVPNVQMRKLLLCDQSVRTVTLGLSHKPQKLNVQIISNLIDY